MNSLAAILILSAVHLSMGFFSKVNPPRLLSFGSGVAIAYIFVDLLPKLCVNDSIIKASGLFPFMEKHVYILALIGFLVFYLVEKKKFEKFSILSYMIFNFMIGYAIADKDDPDVRPLYLFTIAIGLHYFTTDYAMREKTPVIYHQLIRWLAVLSLIGGWALSYVYVLPETAVALVAAYIAGGVILNVTRHELPADRPNDTGSFLLGSFIYSFLILLPHNLLV